jgi:signal recognition particle subunit SEC65
VKNLSVKNLKNIIEQVGLECEGIVDKQDGLGPL